MLKRWKYYYDDSYEFCRTEGVGRGENFGVILALSDNAEYEKRRLFVVARAERRI